MRGRAVTRTDLESAHMTPAEPPMDNWIVLRKVQRYCRASSKHNGQLEFKRPELPGP